MIVHNRLLAVSYLFSKLALITCLEYPRDFGKELCPATGKQTTFDIIICGAGSAGSVLATRLSEETTFNVLLLEYGGEPPDASHIPILWATALMKSPWDYNYVSETDDQLFRGLKDQRSSIPRGKLLGGTSSINCAIYLRPTERDMQRWAEEGLLNWSYDQIYPFMLKAESFHDSERFNPATHNLDGYLDVSPFYSPDPLLPIFGRALSEEMSLEKLKDFNVQQRNNGYGSADGTMRHGLRSSTATGYLSRASYRKNLFVARHTLVRRVIFEQTNDDDDDTQKPKRAIGVDITTADGVNCTVYASKEVILSLGVIVSPQILLLSGIGPEEHLREMGIPVVIHSPGVGYNYQDHVIFPGAVFSDRTNRDEQEIRDESNKLIQDTFVLLNEGIGSLGLTQLIEFLNTDDQSLPWHDIQIMNVRISRGSMFNTTYGYHKMYSMFNWSDESAKLITELNEVTDTIYTLVILSEVNSQGRIKLRTTNPEDQPVIETNLLSDERDFNSLMKGIRFIRDLANTEILRQYGLRLEKLNFKPCRQFDLDQDEYWRCAVKQVATGFYHPAGTVRMGADHDVTAPLTWDMKVKGTSNLRVIDASSMTKLVARNPNAAIIMMAERMSDVIKVEHGKFRDYKSNLYR